MKVLHYVDAENLSWIVPYVEHIKSIECFGIEQALLCRLGGEVERKARENGISVFTWRPLLSGMPLLSPGFVKLIREVKPDIIHTRLSSAAGIAGFWRKYHGVPVVSTFDKPAKAKYYANSSRCISCAEWLKDYMVNAQGMNPAMIDVVHNPVNAARFSRDMAVRNDFRKSLGLSESDILFSGMGIYIRRKGFDVLIKAFAKVCNEYDGHETLRLALIGAEGEKGMRESYASLAKELGVSVIMPDTFVQDVRAWLWASDIFVMPSREEGFSIALLEGLSSGLPAVVSDIEPFTEVIRVERDNGLIAKKDDPESFAFEMLKLLRAGREGRAKISANSLAAIRKHFSLEKAAEKTIAIYARVHSSCDEVSSQRHVLPR